jgi:hypothetical protein
MATISNESAVSWGAIFAGAVGAAVLSLVLFVLGTGLGLAVVSPWARDGISGTAAGVSTIVWVTVVQLLASVLGGYLAGRLRTRWVTVHTDEVFFRDTAHGFLAWGVSTLLMATLLSSAAGAVVSTGAKAAGTVVGSAVTMAGAGAAAAAGSAASKESPGFDPTRYYVDALFRVDADRATAAPSGAQAAPTAAPASPPDKSAEVTRIFAHALQAGELGTTDRQYLAQLVAAHTGLSQPEAEQRVNDAYTQLTQSLQRARDQARQVADDARKASAYLALWLVVSLFVGAFVAAFAATLGGRLRDSSVLATT